MPAPSPDVLDGSGQRETVEGPHKLILVVVDNPDALALIKAGLLDTSYIVIGVQDPLQVIGLVQKLAPLCHHAGRDDAQPQWLI